jgi:hypothetical protein
VNVIGKTTYDNGVTFDVLQDTSHVSVEFGRDVLVDGMGSSFGAEGNVEVVFYK